MSTERKFEGWGAFDKNSIKGELKWFEYEPKKFVDDDIESESAFFPLHSDSVHSGEAPTAFNNTDESEVLTTFP